VSLLRERCRLRALTFVYQGIAEAELRAAKGVAEEAEIGEHRFVRLPNVREAGEMKAPSLAGMPPVYIPARNSVFYSLAASYAEEVGADLIVGGHNKDDATTYPDASPAFFRLLEKALWAGSPILRRRGTSIVLPLSRRTKAQVVKLAASRGVPLELTWSCHAGKKSHCWRCDGCLGRVAAFGVAGVPDPLRRA
jgi:7-cyano-7-deazaguanine synthase